MNITRFRRRIEWICYSTARKCKRFGWWRNCGRWSYRWRKWTPNKPSKKSTLNDRSWSNDGRGKAKDFPDHQKIKIRDILPQNIDLTPTNLFELFFDGEVIGLIKNETERYAKNNGEPILKFQQTKSNALLVFWLFPVMCLILVLVKILLNFLPEFYVLRNKNNSFLSKKRRIHIKCIVKLLNFCFEIIRK